MTVRLSLLVLLSVVAAGCLQGPDEVGTGSPPPVREADFSSANASWVALYSSGCGFCLGEGGYREPTEHFATFVFENGRVLLLEFNVAPDRAGFHVAPHVTYDREELRTLLDEVPRADGNEIWVVNTTTGRLDDPEFAAELRDRWATEEPDEGCADYGADYAMNPEDGAPRHESVVCPVREGDALHPFAAALHEITDDLRSP